MKGGIYLYRAGQPLDYDKVARSLVNDVDISLVDPALHQHMIYYIKQHQNRMREAHDLYAVDRLNFALDYIEKYPERKKIHDFLDRPEKPPPVIKLPFEEDEVQIEISKLLNGEYNENYEIDEIDQLQAEVRRIQKQHASSDDFYEAEAYMQAYTKLCELRENIQVTRMTNTQMKELFDKRREMKEALRELSSRWKNLLDGFKEHCEQEIEDINAQFAREKNEIEKTRKSIPSKYKKYSSELMRMRQKEHIMASSKRYMEAAAQHELVLEMQKEEDAKNEYFWNEKVDKKVKKLENKYKNILKVRRDTFTLEENKIKSEMEREIDSLKAKIKLIQKNIREMQIMQQAAPPPTQSTPLKPPQNSSSVAPSSQPTSRQSPSKSSKANSKGKLPILHIPNDPNAGRKSSSMTFRQRAVLNSRVYTGKVLLANSGKTTRV